MLIGSELKVRPIKRDAPFVLRIESARAREAVVRYDFRFTGFVAGEYDLRELLVRADGKPDEFLPPIMVKVTSLLPPNFNGWLRPIRHQVVGVFGSYQKVLTVAAVLWGLAVIPLGLLGRSRKTAPPSEPEALPEPPSAPVPAVPDSPEPLLLEATAGELDPDRQLLLERVLMEQWRTRFDLNAGDAGEVRARLRAHPEAGALLQGLEGWLYRRPGSKPANLQALLLSHGQNGNGSATHDAAENSAVV